MHQHHFARVIQIIRRVVSNESKSSTCSGAFRQFGHEQLSSLADRGLAQQQWRQYLCRASRAPSQPQWATPFLLKQCKAHSSPLNSFCGMSFQRMMSSVAAEASAGSISRAATLAPHLNPSLALSRGLSDSARQQLRWWIGGCSAWVFSMVVLGGVTRLTRSGLSMTDWKFTGERPPMTEVEWEQEFAKYQQSPEFRLAHSHMTVQDFKFIYYMEWAHRMWGRLLGIGFAVPAAYFLARGYINGALGRRLGLLFMMGGAQGLVGWWMVRSGLKEPQNKQEVPRVSPYRLAAHLTSAFAIYATLVWTTLDLGHPQPLLAQVAKSASVATHAAVSAAGKAQAAAAAALRSRVLPLAVLVSITAISGAFVAGLDAGRAYNTFPLMNGQLVPDDYWDLPGLSNAFENTAAVQLHHRVLALSTLAAVTGVWASARKLPLPGRARLALNITAFLTACQVTLGVTTLLTYVPVSLGAAHQSGALALFTGVLTMLHSLRPPNPSAAALAVSRVAPPAAVLATAAIATAVTQME